MWKIIEVKGFARNFFNINKKTLILLENVLKQVEKLKLGFIEKKIMKKTEAKNI